MSKKTIVRCLAVLVCLGILALSVPTLSSAAKSTTKLGFFQIVKLPALLLTALVPSLGAGQMTSKTDGMAAPRVRPTTDIPIPRPSTGD